MHLLKKLIMQTYKDHKIYQAKRFKSQIYDMAENSSTVFEQRKYFHGQVRLSIILFFNLRLGLKKCTVLVQEHLRK